MGHYAGQQLDVNNHLYPHNKTNILNILFL